MPAPPRGSSGELQHSDYLQIQKYFTLALLVLLVTNIMSVPSPCVIPGRCWITIKLLWVTESGFLPFQQNCIVRLISRNRSVIDQMFCLDLNYCIMEIGSELLNYMILTLYLYFDHLYFQSRSQRNIVQQCTNCFSHMRSKKAICPSPIDSLSPNTIP